MTGNAFQSVLHANLDAAYAVLRQNPPPISAMRSFIETPDAQSGKGVYPVWNDAPAAEKFEGEVTYEGISSQDYELRNEEWGGKGLGLPPRLGRARSDGRHVQAHRHAPHAPHGSAVSGGASAIQDNDVAYDGDNLFVTTGDRINSFGGAGRSLTNVESDIDEARTLMSLIKMANSGAIIDRQPNIILCHTAMETRIKKVVQSAAAATGSNSRVANVVGGYIDQVIATSHLGTTASQMHTYYLIAANAIAKPLMWQRERMMPDRSSGGMSRILDGGYLRAESYLNQEDRQYRFGVEVRGKSGIGLPEMIVRVVN